MITKVAQMLGSVRFWVVTLTAVVSVLNGTPVLETFQLWAASVVGIRTLDSIALKASGN